MKRFSVFALAIFTVLFSLYVINYGILADSDLGYKYRIENGYAVISGTDSTIGGEVRLPDTLGGFSVGAIDDGAFMNNTLINSVVIPVGVKKIGDNAFSGCKNLTAVEISEGVKIIGVDAFSYCVMVDNILMPDSVERIGYFAFSGCKSLKTVKCGENLKSIGNFAFDGCTALNTVYLSRKLEKIGDFAFNGCELLKDIYYPSGKAERAKIRVLSGNELNRFLWHYNNSENGLLAGDVNKDSYVNNKDLTRLFQYLSDWDVEINKSALDTNGDNAVNNKDLTRLFQYLSDWSVDIY